jgi:hypothetical protein
MLTQYCSGDEMENNDNGSACSTYGEGRGLYRVLMGKPEGKNPLGRTGLDGRIILRWILRKWDVGLWNGSLWLRIWIVGEDL